MFTILGTMLHYLLVEVGLTQAELVYIPIIFGLMWDCLIVLSCIKILAE